MGRQSTLTQEEEFDAVVEGLSTIIEPVMIVFVGGLSAMVVALYLPHLPPAFGRGKSLLALNGAPSPHQSSSKAASLCHYQLFHLAWLAQVRDGDTDLQVFWWVVQSGPRPNTGNDGTMHTRLAGAKFLIIHKRPADFLTQRHDYQGPFFVAYFFG